VKYLFILVMLIVAVAGGVFGAAVVWRFMHHMDQTPRIMPGQRVFPMPAGVVPRGGELVLPPAQREIAMKRPNPVEMTEASVDIGRARYEVFCLPCHGPEGQGGVTGPVATRFIPAPDLTSAALQEARTDGYWHSYIMAGGAVMPGYAEAMSSEEAWHTVNFLRSIAAR
jgi:mono/diheme cytochrome c family protein